MAPCTAIGRRFVCTANSNAIMTTRTTLPASEQSGHAGKVGKTGAAMRNASEEQKAAAAEDAASAAVAQLCGI